ncbi:hypothetical protein KY329_05175 [Candidatus Woesearchaeota archaeon]|nr:hypothetical protein [Candidatus Woesearchaeota archaeon]
MKRGWLISQTVDLILLLIGFAILLIFLFPNALDFIFGASEVLETATIPVTVDKALLERSANSMVAYKSKMYSNVQKMLENFAEKPADSSENILIRQNYDPADANSKYRWAFAKIVADKLYDCSLKTTYQADKLAKLLAIAETEPTKCIVCYNIHVAPDARPLLESKKTGRIDDFGFYYWLNIFSPMKQKESYYELIGSGYQFPEGLSETKMQLSRQKNIDYILTRDSEDDIAVVFVHIPLIGGSAARVPGLIGEAGNVDFVSLYSYKNLAQTTLVDFDRDLNILGIEVTDWNVDARCGR